MKETIFLSYAHADTGFVDELERDLQTEGFSVWRDTASIAAGDDVPGRIEEGLDAADWMVLVLSADAVSSGFVAEEWHSHFWEDIRRGRTSLLPIIIADCVVPRFLRHKKWIDFRGGYGSGFSHLLTKLKQPVSIEPKERSEGERAALYRLLNACTSPDYADVRLPGHHSTNFSTSEWFRNIGDIFDFVDELIFDFTSPGVLPAELKYLRIFYAHWLGDGIELPGVKAPAAVCHDVDKEGRDISGSFVMGMSNPHGFEQVNWRLGRVIPCFRDRILRSHCATVFRRGEASHRKLTKSPLAPNYEIEEEAAVFTAPVEWRQGGFRASLGVLAISSNSTTPMTWELQARVSLLATLLGFLLRNFAEHNGSEAGGDLTGVRGLDGVPFGFDSPFEGTYAATGARAISLRREVATFFEEHLLHSGIHTVENDCLRFAD
ncbi:MAG: toll/interleukin-1 receptor domain-containing protein [bacterium]|nr:toll/interleukin-1 receptor domain-containing protein [bacterium]